MVDALRREKERIPRPAARVRGGSERVFADWNSMQRSLSFTIGAMSGHRFTAKWYRLQNAPHIKPKIVSACCLTLPLRSRSIIDFSRMSMTFLQSVKSSFWDL
jgi:hypothetical protein